MSGRPRKKVLRKDTESEQPAQKECATAEAAYRRIVDLCSYHEFCQVKMRERLRRDGIREDLIDAAIGKAVRVGLIDDLRWGEMRASALMRKGVGCDGIIRELRDNGIDATKVDGWPHTFMEKYGDDFGRALDFIRKSPPKSKNPRASAYAKLIRKGYSNSIAAQASAAWYEEGTYSGMR
ncbi:MAG: RecX family transcriptional regulator [Coriobacteriia bacterium]|nr:RecX family transcriptional regulator [Coriobacteriia bacterium]